MPLMPHLEFPSHKEHGLKFSYVCVRVLNLHLPAVSLDILRLFHQIYLYSKKGENGGIRCVFSGYLDIFLFVKDRPYEDT